MGIRIPINERLEKYSMPIPFCGCWLWIGAAHHCGYGRILVDGRAQKAHRVAWQQQYGSIPKGLNVLHRCDMPACVNPQHLFLGTQQDNVTDMIRKQRKARGAEVHRSHLTDDLVRAILADPRKDEAIARSHGVAPGTIWAIKTRKTWKHVN